MSQHHYPAATLYADYLRALFGLAVTAGPLLVVDLADPLVAVFAALTALFLWFGARTGLRHASRIEVSTDGIALRGPIERHLLWHQLERVKLAYYAPRRSRENGWLQLTLGGGRGRPIRVDSTLEDFDRVLERVRHEVEAKALPLDPTTESNFSVLGMAVQPEERA